MNKRFSRALVLVLLFALQACAGTRNLPSAAPSPVPSPASPESRRTSDYLKPQRGRAVLTHDENGINGAILIKGGHMRVVSSDGRLIESFPIEGRKLYVSWVRGGGGGGPVFFVTGDLTADFGSYNGPVTQVFQVKNGHVLWAIAREGRRPERIYLMDSLKTHWEVRRNGEGGIDIFEVACRPDVDTLTEKGVDFQITYTRHSFDGASWTSVSRSEKGYWEYEDNEDFPDRGKFP